MKEYEQTVFISYAWGGESEEIVDQIDASLQKRGIKIVRDKRDLGYKGSISDFMQRIGQGNCVIVVISDKYLRSQNCMYELVEIAEGKQFYDRTFPIVLTDADIYDPVKRLGYVKYWEDKRNELAEAMKTVDPANLQGIREDIDLYDRIRDKISSLTSILKDMNTLTPDIHKDSDFDDLYNAVETRMKGDVSGSASWGKINYIQTLTPNGNVVDVAPPSGQPPYSMRLSPVKDLPREFASLVDRTEQLEFIKEAIQTSTTVLIFGEQGIGKTSLARHLLHLPELPSFSHGVLYVDASSYGLDDLLQFLFDTFFISPPEFKLRDAVIREALQKPNALIFLDNLQLEQDETISLLNAAPHCTFIFSSIEPCLSGEGKMIPLKGLLEKDAMSLFEDELARFLSVTRSLNEEERAAVRKLCALYQGHPFRIVFAASQVAQGKMTIFKLLEESERDDR